MFAIRWLSVLIHTSRYLAVSRRLRGDCQTARRLTAATQGRGVTRVTADFRLVPEDAVTGDHIRSPAGSWCVSWASTLVSVSRTTHVTDKFEKVGFMPFTVGTTTFQLIKVLSNAGENKKSPSCTLGIESNHTLMVGKNPLVISIPNAAHMHNSQAPFFFQGCIAQNQGSAFCTLKTASRWKRWRGQRAMISEQSGSGDHDLSSCPRRCSSAVTWRMCVCGGGLLITAAVTLWTCKRKKNT